MKPFDKFGNKIYSKAYSRMLGYGRVLIRHGYSESNKKPNLFYKKDDNNNVIFFADMRGTEDVPIWEDSSPLFYAKFLGDTPRWKAKRLLEEEFFELAICRLSFYDECEPDGWAFSEGGDGYCVVCGKDFQNDGLYCSEQCQKADVHLYKTNCRVCGKELSSERSINHHLDYGEDKIITVCRGCHLKIHRGTKLPFLKPLDKRNEERFGGNSPNI